jgi:SRSO17 transposase
VFCTKAQLGLEMILQAKARGVPFEFVGMDAHYGQQPWLLTCLDQENITYVADTPCDTRVYLEYPYIGIPPRRGTQGRIPTQPKVLEGKPVEVRALVPSLPWHTLKVRDTQRGELWIRFAALRVWRIQDDLPYLFPEWLLVRQELDGSDTRFSFSKDSPDTPLTTLAQRQSRRYWVERTLQDAKGLAGLDEYQVRGWRGWHHHMTMVILAMLFLLQLKHQLRIKAPMLTLQDTVQILETVMPKKQLTPQQALQIIQDKHLNRSRSRNSYLRKQRIWLKATGFLI